MAGVEPESKDRFLDVVAFVNQTTVFDDESEAEFRKKAYKVRVDVSAFKLQQGLILVGNIDTVEKFGDFTLGL